MRLWKIFYRARRKPSRRISAHYQKHKKTARAIILAKLEELNRHYGASYGKVAIRNQRTRWGSCSKRGNLNFNYRLIFLPPVLLDYVVVHELCHLREFNHSPRFWSFVEEMIPDHRARRKALAGMATALKKPG